MGIATLSDRQLAVLQAAPFTYQDVGATATEPPRGFASFRRSRTLANTVEYADAVDAFLSWQVHARAGVKVSASNLRAVPGAVVVLRIGPAPMRVCAPCRVVYVIDETDRKGFAYGTLPGHPEAGEELFLIERRPDGSIAFTVAAFSRHASVVARLGGRLSELVQRRITERYLSALDG